MCQDLRSAQKYQERNSQDAGRCECATKPDPGRLLIPSEPLSQTLNPLLHPQPPGFATQMSASREIDLCRAARTQHGQHFLDDFVTKTGNGQRLT